MTHYLDRLNLRPNERRLVVFVAVIVFMVLNVWLVWPHFGDWRRTQVRLKKAQSTLEIFNTAVKQQPEYKSRIQSFEKENPAATRDDQSIELLRIIQTKAGESRVNIMSMPPATTETKEFFVEQRQTITVQAREEPLVNFLHDLGLGESMIRVRALSLRPDAPRLQLGGNITLVASYQRKPMTPSATPPPAKPTAPAAKPVPAVPVAPARASGTANSAKPPAATPAPAKPTSPAAKPAPVAPTKPPGSAKSAAAAPASPTKPAVPIAKKP